jgi:hypothetical protein
MWGGVRWGVVGPLLQLQRGVQRKVLHTRGMSWHLGSTTSGRVV